MSVVSCLAEQLRHHSHQRIVVTAADSVLRTILTILESQEEDSPKSYPLVQTELLAA
jgi:hypothetical protein